MIVCIYRVHRAGSPFRWSVSADAKKCGQLGNERSRIQNPQSKIQIL